MILDIQKQSRFTVMLELNGRKEFLESEAEKHGTENKENIQDGTRRKNS